MIAVLLTGVASEEVRVAGSGVANGSWPPLSAATWPVAFGLRGPVYAAVKARDRPCVSQPPEIDPSPPRH